jgi:oxygen-dependent protoporphyrinogen oxidase
VPSNQIVIIGGGISGLATAFYTLKKATAAGQPIHLTVLESSSRWGGKISTDRVDGFVIEGGPDTFLATKPWGVTLCKELGLGERLHGTNPYQKNTYVLHRNCLQPLPDGLAMMIPTNIPAILKSRLVSWFGKARMGLDFFLPPHALNGDESLGAFVSRRLGREAYENLIEPLMSGIYAGDGDALSLASTFPYLRDLEIKYGSLARGALEMRKQSARANGRSPLQGSRSAFLTPTTGLIEIVEALIAHLQNNGAVLRLNASVRNVKRANVKKWNVELENGETLPADGIVLAAPAFAAAKIVSTLDPQLAADLHAIPYASTATVSLGYRQSNLPCPLDGYGYIIPRHEGRRALACTWTSTKFPHRAPDGYALIRVFVGRAGQETDIAWDEASLIELAREELLLTLGINAEPLLARVCIWDKAMPQYNIGHSQLLAHIETALAQFPGIVLAGAGYLGIGIPDCIHSGELAADKILSSA